MIFEHNKEKSLLRDMVRDCAKSEFLPSAKKRDENERFYRPLMFDRFSDPDLTCIIFPEDYGSSTAVTLSVRPSLGSNPIFFFGSEQQKEQFLVPLGTGT